MKKTAIVLLLITLLLLACGCKKDGGKKDTSSGASQKEKSSYINSAMEEETFDIKTSVVTLKYPKKWEERLTIKTEDDAVKFFDGELEVFAIVFKENKDGTLLGYYKDVPVYVVDYPVSNEDQEFMQEDIDVIFQHLQADENFSLKK